MTQGLYRYDANGNRIDSGYQYAQGTNRLITDKRQYQANGSLASYSGEKWRGVLFLRWRQRIGAGDKVKCRDANILL